jgi:hypothetical protein
MEHTSNKISDWIEQYRQIIESISSQNSDISDQMTNDLLMCENDILFSRLVERCVNENPKPYSQAELYRKWKKFKTSQGRLQQNVQNFKADFFSPHTNFKRYFYIFTETNGIFP